MFASATDSSITLNCLEMPHEVGSIGILYACLAVLVTGISCLNPQRARAWAAWFEA